MRLGLPIIIAIVAVSAIGFLATHPPGSSTSPTPTAEARAPSPAVPVAAPPSAMPANDPARNAPPKSADAATVPQRAPSPPAAAAPAVAAAMRGDPAQGASVFRKCQVCHSLQAGKTLQGPSLAGIVGRKSGQQPNFNYSDAMKQANLTWDAATLDAYLIDPQKVVPGNHMPFPGLKSQHERDDVIAYLAGGTASAQAMPGMAHAPAPAAATAQPSTAAPPPPAAAAGSASAPSADLSDIRYTLRTGIAEGRMVFLGVGGAIDGKVNPELTAAEGQGVQITLINGEGAEHDIALPDENAKSPRVTGKGASTTLAFRAGKPGDFVYFCSTPGHRQAGMEGKFSVTAKPPAQALAQADISREPTDVPPPIGKRGPQIVRVDLQTSEVEGRLANDVTFGFWTFNGKVPGPMLRVRVGDTVEVHLKNAAESSMIHSVDFHAATGPGGGAAALQVDPGDEKSMKFKALVPGLYVYHCATPMVAEHIANGMYGMILVEPEEGLPKVDHEFYVMQGEVYTDAAFGQHGSQEFSVEKLLNERPEYFVLNGAVGALTKLHPLRAKVGESVRIYFGVGGPNFTSAFHVIGEIFEKVYDGGGLQGRVSRGIQTVTVPPGGATVVEFTPVVPGNFIIVDHALARMERGLAGMLIVEGPPNPAIYDGKVMPGMGH
ncbi:MAG TPA: copper-containing nitrite reductase [Candidatus Cybelea sp.]|nr:copper-containing nitrite reductase [Candidatus Cybelea sp.]